MFQPIPKPLIPAVIKARVPVWLLVVALATQYAINGANRPSDPNCRMNVQRVPQAYTSLSVKFEEVLPNRGNKVAKVVSNIIARPRLNRENYVLIENLTVPCNGKGKAEYLGQANGQVHLKDGRIVDISGASDKSNTLNCRISAK